MGRGRRSFALAFSAEFSVLPQEWSKLSVILRISEDWRQTSRFCLVGRADPR